MDKFIVIAGNIGAGKSSLVGLLSAQLGFEPFYEPVNDNPYLSDFYQDMPAWAFHSQIYFLTHRLRIHNQLLAVQGSVIQDRSVYEDAEVFAHNLFLQGAIRQRDYDTYQDLYKVLVDFLPPPDLVVYLKASVETLQKRIALRGRDYERTISSEYLSQLNNLYESWTGSFTLCPLLIVPCDNLDFVARPEHLTLIVDKVKEMLIGKLEVHF